MTGAAQGIGRAVALRGVVRVVPRLLVGPALRGPPVLRVLAGTTRTARSSIPARRARSPASRGLEHPPRRAAFRLPPSPVPAVRTSAREARKAVVVRPHRPGVTGRRLRPVVVRRPTGHCPHAAPRAPPRGRAALSPAPRGGPASRARRPVSPARPCPTRVAVRVCPRVPACRAVATRPRNTGPTGRTSARPSRPADPPRRARAGRCLRPGPARTR